ncbi:MAG: RNA methyltransferase [Bacteroidota bacterium]
MIDTDLLHYLEGFLTEERKVRFQEVLSQRTKFLTVVMEDVFQLHNTSAVLRSCDAFGIQEAHVVEDRFGSRLDKNIAMGAEQWVDIHRYSHMEHCIDTVSKKGYKILATVPHGDCSLLGDYQIREKTALFFGTEREGLSEVVKSRADGFLKIPMVGFSESLNISVSAAIILETLSKQLRASELPWSLSDKERLEKRLDWTKKSIKDVEGIIQRYLSER